MLCTIGPAFRRSCVPGGDSCGTLDVTCKLQVQGASWITDGDCAVLGPGLASACVKADPVRLLRLKGSPTARTSSVSNTGELAGVHAPQGHEDGGGVGQGSDPLQGVGSPGTVKGATDLGERRLPRIGLQGPHSMTLESRVLKPSQTPSKTTLPVCMSAREGAAAEGVVKAAAAAVAAEADTAISVEPTSTVASWLAAAAAAAATGLATCTDFRRSDDACHAAFRPTATASSPALVARTDDRCVPYSPYIRRTCVFAKIPGYEPEQITPGYEQRLAALAAAFGGGRCRGCGHRRLGSLYIRSGCVELIMEEEDWGTDAALGTEDGEGEKDAAASTGLWLAVGGAGAGVTRAAAVSMAAAGGSAAGGALPSPPTGSNGFRGRSLAPSSPRSSLSSMDLAAIIQALHLRDELALVSEDGGAEADAESDARGRERAVGGGLGDATYSGAAGRDAAAPSAGDADAVAACAEDVKPVSAPRPGDRETRHAPDGSPPAPTAPQPTTVFRRSGEPHGSSAPFLLGFAGEARSGVRVVALQPRVLLLAPPAPHRAAPEAPAAAPQAGRPGQPDGPSPTAAAPSLPHSQQHSQPWRQPPGHPQQDSHRHQHHHQQQQDDLQQQQQQQHQQQDDLQQRQQGGPQQPRHEAHPRRRDGRVQQRQEQFSPDPDSPQDTITSENQHPLSQTLNAVQTQSPSRSPSQEGEAASQDAAVQYSCSTAGAATSLCAALHCSAALATEDGPGALEVLLRSHGRYLPLRARWRHGDGSTAAAAAAAEAASPAAAAGSERGAFAGGGGAVVPVPLPDAAVGADVNELQLLELQLLEAPRRPGIALVDFRWRGAPCRALPVVLTAHPAVAAELQAAAAGWSRPQAELDELLLDFGTWEFHVAAAAAAAQHPHASTPHTARRPSRPPSPAPEPASNPQRPALHAFPANQGAVVYAARGSERSSGSGGSGGGGGPLQPLGVARLLDLSAHLLRYVSACGWVHTAEHIRSRLYDMHVTGITAPGGSGSGGAAAAAAGAANATEEAAALDSGGSRGGSNDVPPMPAAAAAAAAAASSAAGADGACAVATDVGVKGAREAVVEAQSRQGPITCLARDLAPRAAAIRPRGGGAGAGGASPGSVPGFAMQGHTPWTSAVLLPALGLGRSMPAEMEAFHDYSEPWINKLSPVLLFTDLSSLVALLLRERREAVLAPSSTSILTACAVSIMLVLAWLVLPYATWVRLLRPSRYARIACYVAAKGLVALGGFPLPAAVQSNLPNGALMLMEGIILPAASLLPPVAAVSGLLAMALMTHRMMLVAGVVTRASDAALHCLLTFSLGLATTVACRAYLHHGFRRHFQRCQQQQQQQQQQQRQHGPGHVRKVGGRGFHAALAQKQQSKKDA